MTQDSRALLTLQPGHVSLDDLRRIYRGEVRLAMADSAWPAVRAAQATVQDIIDADAVVYGINTGFGKLAQDLQASAAAKTPAMKLRV